FKYVQQHGSVNDKLDYGNSNSKQDLNDDSNLEVVKGGIVPFVTVAYGNTHKDLNDDPVAMEVQSSLVDQTNMVKIGKRVAYPVVANYDMNTWGPNYARVMIDLQADVELKDNIVEECPKNIGLGVAKNLKKPCQNSRGVSVGPKVGFKPHKEYRPVPKKRTARPSGNNKKSVAHTDEVGNSNPFDVLNSVDNDVEFGTNVETTNLVNSGANSSGSSFMTIENISTISTPIVDKIEKFEDLLINWKAILVDEFGNLLKNVYCPGDYDSEDEVASFENDMAHSLA
nr:hypothetical protein [Tanacetum cinerariifolium]